MPFREDHLEEYKKWAKNFEADGGQPCIHLYYELLNKENELSVRQLIRHLVYKDSNSEPKHIKDEPQTIGPMVIPE